MKAIATVLDRVLRVLCVAFFAALVIVVVLQVFTRQVLDNPSTWTTVAAQYLFVWLSLLGAAWVFSEKEHIAVDFLTRALKINSRRSMEVFVNVVIGLFGGFVLLWGGIRGVGITWSQNVSGLPVNVGMMYLALPIAGAVIVFYALHHIVEALNGRGLPSLEEEIREAV